jgi:hypothetical protein
MQVNGKSEAELPPTISIRTKDFAPLLSKWRQRNQRVPWSCLLGDALKKELAPLAGKRFKHLVEDKEQLAAAEARADAYVNLRVAKLRAMAKGHAGKAAA